MRNDGLLLLAVILMIILGSLLGIANDVANFLGADKGATFWAILWSLLIVAVVLGLRWLGSLGNSLFSDRTWIILSLMAIWGCWWNVLDNMAAKRIAEELIPPGTDPSLPFWATMWVKGGIEIILIAVLIRPLYRSNKHY